nr:hypothetical protein [uncultured Pseudomonas sp.]
MAVIASCASVPPEIALGSRVYNAGNAGLAVGSLVGGGPYGTWLEFREVESGKSYGWGVKGEYAVWLPPGEYEVYKLGARQGVMGAFSEPLTFNIEIGAINYLGELIYGCPVVLRPEALYGVMDCGFLAAGQCTVPAPSEGICVSDKQTQAVDHLIGKTSSLSAMDIKSAVMKRIR